MASELVAHGFGEQLLAAAFKFKGGEHPVYFIYGFKRGAYWPFVPTGEGKERDNSEELELKAKLEKELRSSKTCRAGWPSSTRRSRMTHNVIVTLWPCSEWPGEFSLLRAPPGRPARAHGRRTVAARGLRAPHALGVRALGRVSRRGDRDRREPLFSEVAGFIPCELCWYQRICMYPLHLLTLFAALTSDYRFARYLLPLPIVGAGVSVYHLLIENAVIKEPSACQIGGAGCAVKWINEFGYITIPTLALTGFALLSFSRPSGSRTPGGRRYPGRRWLAANRADRSAAPPRRLCDRRTCGVAERLHRASSSSRAQSSSRS